MKEYEISCEICSDLYPLVFDEIASTDSTNAVKNHLTHCEHCAKQYGEATVLHECKIDDEKVIHSIRKKLYLVGLCIVVLGALIGIGLTNTMGMFYNFMLMPIVGGVSYMVMKHYWYYTEIALFLISYVWTLIWHIAEGAFIDGISFSDFYAPVVFSVVYVGLAMVGVIIAMLLVYGLRKEDE